MVSKLPSKRGRSFGWGIFLLIVGGIYILYSVSELIDEPSSDLVGSLVFSLILSVIGILLILKGRQKGGSLIKKPLDKQKEADINRFLSEVRKGNLGILRFTGMEPDLIRQKNEKIFLMLPNINLIEHVITEKLSGGMGISISGYGLTTGVHSEKEEGKEVLDNGKLTLTNNRLLFDGAKLTSETMLRDILVITPYSDGIGLKSRAREKVQYFVITKPKQCIAQMTCEERIYEEPMNGEWLAAIIEGAIHSGEYEETDEGEVKA